jgi:hypothetical protein
MNANLSPNLRAHLTALDIDASDSACADAQRKLEKRLAQPPPRRASRQWIGWMTAAASACLVVALVMLPTSNGVAFAVVQKHLSDFNTLSLTIEQQSQGIALPTIHVRMNRQGDVRTDLGDATSIVVSPRQHRMLTLLHGPHQAMATPLNAAANQQSGDNLSWLDAIRRFQGQARPLPGHRIIDGIRTTGWALDTEGLHIELWADAEGLPRAIELNGGTLYSQHMQVAVDRPIDASVFSVLPPAGYADMPGSPH